MKSRKLIKKGHLSEPFFYISDIHIDDRLVGLDQDKRKEVCDDACDTIVNFLNKGKKPYLLIAGDICSDPRVYELFISSLKMKVPKNVITIITLGNHEMYDMEFRAKKLNYEEIKTIYKNIIEDAGFIFLQNEIYYKDKKNRVQIIEEDKLKRLSAKALAKKLDGAYDIILGSLGFASRSKEFSATRGIYYDLEIIDVEKEKKLCKEFRSVYKKFIKATENKIAIIMTHISMIDWLGKEKYKNKKIYISGHTYRNRSLFKNNACVFEDNQIGHVGEYKLNVFAYTNKGIVYKARPV